MQSKKQSIDLDVAFDEIASAMSIAASDRKIAQALLAAERHGLVVQGDDTADQSIDWAKTISGKTLRFRWHWYDQPQAFSVRPDMHVMTLEMRQGDQPLRVVEERFEDLS
jgi:hypothetical protein